MTFLYGRWPTQEKYYPWLVVGDCEWPNFSRVNLIFLVFWVLRNSAPNSTSAVDAATSLRITHVMWMFPCSWMSGLSLGVLPRKKYPPTLLLPCPADKYVKHLKEDLVSYLKHKSDYCIWICSHIVYSCSSWRNLASVRFVGFACSWGTGCMADKTCKLVKSIALT